MRKIVRSLILLAVLAQALPAGAQTSAGAKPDFAPMTYFVGLWKCTFTANPDPQLVGTMYSFQGATDPDGYWEVLELHDGRINITLDRVSNQWEWIYLGNGGDYSLMTTSGWNGDTMVLKDATLYGGGPLGAARFTKLSDMQFRAAYSVQTQTATEKYESVCTRV